MEEEEEEEEEDFFKVGREGAEDILEPFKVFLAFLFDIFNKFALPIN